MSAAAQTRTVRTTCPYCGVGCGVVAEVENAEQRVIAVQGDPDHPANFGRLCSKGSALGETVGLEKRLLHPEIGDRRVSWDDALDHVADRLGAIVAEHGPDSVAFYVSGQLLTEDYYVANKLLKGFIGTANIDTNSRLCMASSVVGHKRAFGSDTVPGCYEDFDHAELIVLVGSNTAWCHPIIFQRMRKAKEANPNLKIVVIDPRRTATCDIADLHLALRPGSDVSLFNGLLAWLAQQGLLDFEFMESHTEGFGAAIRAARESAPGIPAVAAACGLSESDVSQFFAWFAKHNKTVSVYSQGVNQSSSGSDKVNSIINCHLATGRIGAPGMGPFSVTGQPNAMGGREVGGLANQLAAHMDYNDPADIDRVGRFWNASAMADHEGLKAVDLFEAVLEERVRAVWIMATNPVVSLPDADRVRAALQACELVVVSDCIRETDTADLAHVRLPASGWGEKDGTVTNSERRISRQRPLFAAPGEARPDWCIMTQVARRMGFAEAFSYETPAAVFREHAALSGFENNPDHRLRDFDISGLSGLDENAYDALEPVQWPVTGDDTLGTPRMFEDHLYFTPNRRARLLAVEPRDPVHAPDAEYPLVLNTGRIRDQWHTMTRTGLSPRLSAHIPEPFVAVHPQDAARFAVADGELVRVRSRWGSMLARAEISDAQDRGSVFVPMHWTAQNSTLGRVGALVNPVTDPVSGQPESKHTPVIIEPWRPAWHGFLLTRRRLAIADVEYCVEITGDRFLRYELAGDSAPADWPHWARKLLCDAEPGKAEWVDYSDTRAGRYRGARIVGGAVESCLFVAPDIGLPDRSWLGTLFSRDTLSDAERMSLLAGKPGRGMEDAGPVVCACFGVGRHTLEKAIAEQGLNSVEAIGSCLNAGTNCGSCIPELRELLAGRSG